MKKKFVCFVAPIAMLAASTTMAAHLDGITPYVGADAEWRHMSLEKNFGGNLFSHNYPQGNFYAGLRFNEYFAIEGGYETTERKTRTNTLFPGDFSAGVFLEPGVILDQAAQFNSTSQVKGAHANLVGTLPISDAYRLQLLAMVGFARLKAKFTRTAVLVDGVGTNSITNYQARKSILRLGAGLQHMINCNWGVRAMVKWENTKKLKMTTGIDGQTGEVKAGTSLLPKNSFIYSIGAFYTFN